MKHQPPTSSAAGLSVSDRGYTLSSLHRVLTPENTEVFEFRILGPDGDVVREFSEQHEHAMHLMVLRRDLAHFQHLHPLMAEDGTWSAQVQLPEAGNYRAFADFVTHGESLTLSVDLFAPGRFDPMDLPDPAETTSIGGYEVKVSPSTAYANQAVVLTFTIAAAGREVRLSPLMGALGHLVIIREGDLAYAHAHPGRADERGSVSFHANFPSLGRYRLFLQFSEEGNVHTAAFTYDVAATA